MSKITHKFDKGTEAFFFDPENRTLYPVRVESVEIIVTEVTRISYVITNGTTRYAVGEDYIHATRADFFRILEKNLSEMRKLSDNMPEEDFPCGDILVPNLDYRVADKSTLNSLEEILELDLSSLEELDKLDKDLNL